MFACLLYDKIHIKMVKTASKNYKWILLALICATYFLAQGTRQIFNTVLPQIKADFAGVGIDDAQLGLVGSAFTLVFGLTIPLGGVLADMFVTGSNHVVDGGRLCMYQPYVAPKEGAK